MQLHVVTPNHSLVQAIPSPVLIPNPDPYPNPNSFVSPGNLHLRRRLRSIRASNSSSIVVSGDERVAALWDYQFLFVSQRSESPEPIDLVAVSGEVPADFPAGTYYLTGPGIFSDDHGSKVHPLDGHGYLRSFSFAGDGAPARFAARYVETEAKTEEHELGSDTWRFTHRGPFSVLRGGKRLGNTKVMKNVANTSVLVWGRRLMCLWEGGDPYEIDSATLKTVGKVDVVGIDGRDRKLEVHGRSSLLWDLAATFLKPILYGIFNMPPKRLLSHYKIDAQRNRLLTVSCNAEDMLLPQSHFTFYEFNSNFKMMQKKEFIIPDHIMIHDWAFTESYYIIFANRIKLDIGGAMTAVSGVTPMITAISGNPSKNTTPIYLLPRFDESENNKNGGLVSRDWKIPVEAPSRCWVIHTANSYQHVDQQNGSLNIQLHAGACSYEWFNFQKLFGYDWRSGKLDPSIMNIKNEGQNEMLPHLIQVSITLNTNGTEKCELKPLNKWNLSADFPIINPAFSGLKNTFVFAAASSGSRSSLPNFPFDTVAKLNLQDDSVALWSVGPRRFIGEPIFVPKDSGVGEDNGYLLVVEYAVAVQRCFLVILDAKNIGKPDALVARLEIPKHLNFPLGFHGFWAPEGSI